MKKKFKKIVENKYFQNLTIFLIVLNFIVLVFSTEGFNTLLIENLILAYFTLEVVLKVLAYNWVNFWRDGWNKFDFIIVVLGLIPLFGIPMPSGAAGLRAIRLLRLIRVVPSFRVVIEAIGRSASQMGAVFGLTLIILLITTLMGTMTFQKELPEYFGNMFISFTTLLQMATFNNLSIVGISWKISPIGTLLVFPLFFIGVPLLTLNLLIGVLSNALKTENKEKDVGKSIRSVERKLNNIEKVLKENKDK